ncbi:hypothetical protein, partial [Staphylococcus arlettae]|uniref:hypothetical protein n=1 Tax=Staphylococcus arlettae TaxID=29378 RepID=UPI001EE66BE7
THGVGQKSDFEKMISSSHPARLTSVEKGLGLKRIFNADSYCQYEKRLEQINIVLASPDCRQSY